MTRTLTRDTRLDFRLTREHKTLIEEAAQMVGLTVSQFVTTHALEAAHRIVSDRNILAMTQRDYERFAAAIETDTPPNDAALQAATRYNAWRQGEREPR